MNEQPRNRRALVPARSFDLVADAYDRARPSYPDEAVTRLLAAVGHDGPRIDAVELGAGTGLLTERLLAHGCSVVATDPSEAMLQRLRRRAPAAHAVAAAAEQIPVPTRSADLVVAAQAFHWFDADRVLRETARVLRPGGQLAVVWNSRDERIPWVKRLGRIIGTNVREERGDPTAAIDETGMFESVERTTFRFWQPLDRTSLRELVSSRSNVALMSDFERERVLRRVDELYAEYGRMADGMLLPYVTTVCRAAVLPWALPAEPSPEPPPAQGSQAPDVRGDTDGPDDASLLIDFR
jgi:ubiquinone/menaquinone biosynthesis C-methylase UbiE